jgi:hypothetical protein
MRRAAIFLVSGLLFLDGVLMAPTGLILLFLFLDGAEGIREGILLIWWLLTAAGLPPAAVDRLLAPAFVLAFPGLIGALLAYVWLSGALKRRGVPAWMRPLPAILGILLALLALHALEPPVLRRSLPMWVI